MSTAVPRVVRRTVLLALAGLAAAVPFSSPDGTGMQWDELVLGCVAAASAWTIVRRTRTMSRAAALPWRVVATAMGAFLVGQLLAGSFPGPAFDGFGVDDVLTLLGATTPLATAAVLARRISRTRWVTLAVDGAMVTVALLVVTEVLRAPVVNPVGAPDDLRSLVLAYGGYTAVMLGTGATLCTVSTGALRRTVTTMLGGISLQAAAALCEAMAIVAPSPLWTAGSDLAVALSLQVVVLAALRAPDRYEERGARASAPVLSPVGLAVLVAAVLTVPLAVGVALVEGEPLTTVAQLGIAAVFVLLALRLVLRMREDDRITQDIVRSEEDFRELVEASSDGVAIVDGGLRLQFTSPAARALLGLPDGADDVALLDLVEDPGALRRGLATGQELHFRVGERELEATSSDRSGAGRHVLFLRDATTRRRRERELERMAYTDHLTGLPNRAHLFSAMDVPGAGERGLLVLDLDGFKAVNDLAGHEAGDQLLVEMARRLSTLVREDDLVARLGGDEFAVVVTGTLDESIEVAQRVVDALSLPHRTGDRSFAVGASVGVAPLGAAGGQVAFREADDALREAKRAGKGCVRVFRPEELGADELDLATALAEDQLEMRFTTTLDADGRVSFVQTDPVWVHPVRGVVPPQELWAAAERQGLSTTMQLEGLQRACTAVAGMAGVDLLLALPTGQVSGAGLEFAVGEVLRGTGLAASRLVLVVTEETLLTGTADLLPALENVRGTGVRIFLDDYGMGHSLFALLARVPLDGVRVDLGGLAARDDTERALQVLAAIVRTTSSFGLTTIADGVDTAELRDQALAVGAEHVTGRVAPVDLTDAEVAALLTTPALHP